jgi:hypothetical protein
MEKEFIPYELALRMKGLGFDERCFRYEAVKKICENQAQPGGCQLPNVHCAYPKCTIDSSIESLPIPVWQQAFKWFRENHGLCIVIKPIDDKKLELGYNLTKNGLIMSAHLTYESAELFSLKKLIETVEQNKSE